MKESREHGRQMAGQAFTERKTSRMVVVVPVKESTREQLREVVTKGPPFDLPSSGLDGHYVFLTEREAIFVFEAGDRSALERPVSDADVWAVVEAWEQYLEGRPRIAEDAYSWTRSDVLEGVSFAPTPGPGDSDGGDVYPP